MLGYETKQRVIRTERIPCFMPQESNAHPHLLGVIGGMGPLATIDFLNDFYNLSRAARDQDYLTCLVDMNTQIPDRTACLLGKGASPLPELLRSARRLTDAGADLLLMTCNTAHAFLPDLKKEIETPFLSLIQVTVDRLQEIGAQKVAVLATEGVAKSRLYEHALETAGITFLPLRPDQQALCTSLIYDYVKQARMPQDIGPFNQMVQELEAEGADYMLLACTELPVFYHACRPQGSFLNPSLILAQRAILALGGKLREPFQNC